MATLEIHDGLGRVRRVTVSRDQTLLFGSSPKCDLILDDAEVLPFHGWLRWKRDRFKVDASPEAEFLSVNGQKMASASFHQGDEIQVGSCRIFMISVVDEPTEAVKRPRDDQTIVQPPPFLQGKEPQAKETPTIIKPAPLPRLLPH